MFDQMKMNTQDIMGLCIPVQIADKQQFLDLRYLEITY